MVRRLKTDPKGNLQFGLIAEEVDTVYPELVIRDGAGEIQGIRYDELAPILLHEVQQQQRKLAQREEQMAALDAKIQAQDQKLAKLEQANAAMQAAMVKLLTKEERVAMR